MISRSLFPCPAARRLTTLSDGPGHIALAERLSRHKGHLNLSGLTSLSDEAAESLLRLVTS